MVGCIFLGRPGSFRLFIYYNISLIYLIFPSISALYAPFVYLRRPLSRLTLNLKCQRASGNTDASAQLFLFFFFLGSFLKVSYILSLDSELRFYVSGRVDWKCLFCLLIYLLFPKTSPGSELKNSQREIKWAESAAREKLFKGMKIDNAHAAAAGVFFCPQ